MSIDELKTRYRALAHAIQSGVSYKMPFAPEETQAKHLRVGVNMAMCEHGALVALLLEKGLFTEEEYYTKLIEILEREVNSYQDFLSAHHKATIKLL